MSAAPKITALRGGHVTLAAAADAFLATPRTANPNTHRAYASAIDRTIERLGRDRPLAEIADAEIGQALAELWGRCAPATWNRNRAAVTSWLTWWASSGPAVEAEGVSVAVGVDAGADVGDDVFGQALPTSTSWAATTSAGGLCRLGEIPTCPG
ncbi:hypothetical protein [Nonomuraea longispora]|uniref:hypothetical protein n=1 Tax=Nonomuraea longispora TaxID=1848320 RepID=UPI001FE2F37D|nr:hypothetical protein [Nonomuraea longispora]